MKKGKSNIRLVLLAVAVAIALTFGVLALLDGQGRQVSADAVTYYSTSTVFGGGTGYTTTTTSAGVSSAEYGTAQVQVHNSISGTSALTVTAQFSIEPGTCANARYWYTATAYEMATTAAGYTTYADDVTVTTGTRRITTTVAAASAPSLVQVSRSHQFTVAASGDVMMALPTQGNCFRVVVASESSLFTPTVYVRMVDIYQ